MPSLQKVKARTPTPVADTDNAGKVAAINKNKCIENNADTRESVGERSGGVTASLPQAVVDDGNTTDVINDDMNTITPHNPTATAGSADSDIPTNQNQTNQPTYSSFLERFSEYRIEKASSIDDLKTIRHRLMLLVDRVNDRLTEMRVKELLSQCLSDKFSSEITDERSTQELVDRLSQDIDTSTSSNSKITNIEILESTEMNNRGGKRQCIACAICSMKFALPSSSSSGCCEICEVSGLCDRCYSSCPSCLRSTCVDCLFSCGDCGVRYQCSDCVIFGEGKCITCREKAKNGKNGVDGALGREKMPSEHAKQNSQLPKKCLSNKTSGSQHESLTSASLSLPQCRLTAAPSQAPSQTNATPSELAQQSLLSISEAKANPTRMPSRKLYSIHRFILSDNGKIGIHIAALHENKKCIVSLVNPNSVAFRHGVEVKDEIIGPKSTKSQQDEYSNIYDLFLKAANHRPLLFEVKRKYTSTEAAETLALDGPHSHHRFIITEPGSLGLSIMRRKRKTTSITAVEPNSLGDIYGLRVNDIICETFKSVTESAKSGKRPWILEVWRAITDTDEGASRLHVQECCSVDNPFIFYFPKKVSTDTTEEKVAEDEAANSSREDDASEKDDSNVSNEQSTTESKDDDSGIIVIDDE